MAKTVAVSFEGNDVKILHSSLKGNTLSITKAETIAEQDFDEYLGKSKTSDFIVISSFTEFYHDTVTMPIIKAKYREKVLESKIRKATNRHDITYTVINLDEQRTENKAQQEFYYIAVANEEVNSIIDRFQKYDKTVTAVYPSLISAAALIARYEPDKSVLGVLNAGREMEVFFLKEGKIHFSRNYDSLEPELTDFDIQNINMTINYCFQSLRTNPSSVMLLGGLSASAEITSPPISPLATFLRPDNILCSREEFETYIQPIAAVYTPKASSIMTPDFKNIFMLKRYLTNAAAMFILVSVLLLGLSLYTGKHILDKRKQIVQTTASLSNMDNIYVEYQDRSDKLNTLMPLIEFLNQDSPDLGAILVQLGKISSRNIKFQSIESSALKSDLPIITIKGRSKVDSYAALQNSYESMMNSIKKIKQVQVKSGHLDISRQTFNVELQYKKSG